MKNIGHKLRTAIITTAAIGVAYCVALDITQMLNDRMVVKDYTNNINNVVAISKIDNKFNYTCLVINSNIHGPDITIYRSNIIGKSEIIMDGNNDGLAEIVVTHKSLLSKSIDKIAVRDMLNTSFENTYGYVDNGKFVLSNYKQFKIISEYKKYVIATLIDADKTLKETKEMFKEYLE